MILKSETGTQYSNLFHCLTRVFLGHYTDSIMSVKKGVTNNLNTTQ